MRRREIYLRKFTDGKREREREDSHGQIKY